MRFLPGTEVRVTEGTFVGETGRVVSRTEACALYEQVGGEPPPLKVTPEMVFVILEIFGRHVPVTFYSTQLDNRT
jgi:transcription antitermination factor NusG